jgi:co-chaperonin GroES (HSP10)
MITPTKGRLIVSVPLPDKMSSVIEVPDQFKQSQTARVVSANSKLPVKTGDNVLLHPNAAWTNIVHDGEPMRVVLEEYVLAVME